MQRSKDHRKEKYKSEIRMFENLKKVKPVSKNEDEPAKSLIQSASAKIGGHAVGESF